MQMSFNSRVRAEGRFKSIYGRRTLGGFDLMLTLEVSVPANERPTDAIAIEHWTASVNCGRTGAPLKSLGWAWQQSPTIIQTYDYPNSSQVTLVLELTPEKLACLEAERSGGDLELQLQVSAVGRVLVHILKPGPGGVTAEYRGQPHPAHAHLNHTVRLTEWIQVLEQMEYQRVMVFSVAIPFKPATEHFDAAYALLIRAQQQLIRGDFDGVVSLSRKVLDSMVATSGERDAIRDAVSKFRGLKEVREGMSKQERALLVQDAIRHYTHLAHHVDDQSGSPEWYSRGDAAFLLTLASAAFSEAVARHGT